MTVSSMFQWDHSFSIKKTFRVGNLVPRSLIDEAEGDIWSSKKIQFFGLARL